ncbi:MAG TPA: hypothetical protein VKE93_15065 [Candidatus Angelobacter sp.]|nr:hypothetical protein [Candidatus Angelobacter sp.]
MIRAIRITACAAALLSSCYLLSQQPSSQDAPAAAARPVAAKVKGPDSSKAADKMPKLTEDQKLALQLLETSEAASRGFEAPMRSFSLMNVAQSMATTDQARARTLLNDAFRATLEIHDDDDTKARIQEEIFRTLLPLSQEDVEELLPQAEMRVRKPITDIIVARYAEKKQFDKALDLINQINAVDEFPYGSAAKVMEAMPPEMTAEKQSLFSQAVASFKSHEHYQPGLIRLGNNTLTDLVVKFGATMPPKLVLAAIDEILAQGKAAAEEQMNITVGGDGGTTSFGSRYQYDLFALLPLLEHLDESRAKQLLEENQALQAQLQQFPQGLSSLDPQPAPGAAKESAGNAKRRGLSTMVRQGLDKSSGPGQSAAAAQIQMNQETLRRARDIAQEGETDPTQAMAHAMTLPVKIDGPMGGNSPRGNALEAIAKANGKKNPAAAEQALSDLRKLIPDLPLRLQAQYLSSAGAIYLQMDEKSNAEKVVSEGFKVADKMLENDVNPANPNQALKAWWPSADAYRRFVEVQAKISHPATLNVLKEISDPEIRATESIMVARSLLGLPLKRFIVSEKRKDTNMMMMTDNN